MSHARAEAVGATRADQFEDFYASEHAPAVRRVALLVGSSGAAEDVVHDAMVEIYRRWGSIERPAAYLHRCCVNGSMRWHKRRGRERSVDPPPDRASFDSDEFVQVVASLDGLTIRQRTAVVLRYLDGMSEAEIATALGCRPGSVGPLLSRAKKTLRREWTL